MDKNIFFSCFSFKHSSDIQAHISQQNAFLKDSIEVFSS